MAAREVLPTTLMDIIQETPRVCTFRLALPEKSPFSFQAGQFVMASIPGFLNTKGRPVRRAYSVASSPKDLEKGFLELTITRVGEGGFFPTGSMNASQETRYTLTVPMAPSFCEMRTKPLLNDISL